MTSDSEPRRRFREYGLSVGLLPPGPLNAITDVPGVRVGQVTLMEGEGVRTGVTALVPHGGNIFQERVPAGIAVGNGFGKLAGITQVHELGELETPIVLTNTLSVAAGLAGLIEWTLRQPGNEDVRSVNAVVGETNDGLLNDIRARVVTPEHVLNALEIAAEFVEEGAVGAGAGTVCFGWKGGIGTGSRRLDIAGEPYTLGTLVQTNYGGHLHICGVPIDLPPPAQNTGDGSVMIVLATDAPLSDRNLTRLAKRAFLALGRTGSYMANSSGDYAIAFSTSEKVRRGRQKSAVQHTADLPNDLMTPLFQAAVEATEEAIYNSLFKAHTVTGQGGKTIHALPIPEVLERVTHPPRSHP
ncbi:P1 family peptidase [Deinococcus fonticola]|uniref:DmpA family aminopeptidase n=1 Tax=Deinococcus fonticola TaxID=2528713 RepID=UPI00107558AD|nr:P1 family peptidase [Deinococcus fonticola]